jgi:hypothetical protein
MPCNNPICRNMLIFDTPFSRNLKVCILGCAYVSVKLQSNLDFFFALSASKNHSG